MPSKAYDLTDMTQIPHGHDLGHSQSATRPHLAAALGLSKSADSAPNSATAARMLSSVSGATVRRRRASRATTSPVTGQARDQARSGQNCAAAASATPHGSCRLARKRQAEREAALRRRQLAERRRREREHVGRGATVMDRLPRGSMDR